MKCRLVAGLAMLLALGPLRSHAAPQAPASATPPVPATSTAQTPATAPPQDTRSGRDIYARFRDGLADPHCEGDNGGARWRDHFSAAPARLAAVDSDVLPLFGYVVDAVRAAGLPTEYALIPFVESGYRPGVRSAGGPAGLWQMIAVTARDHHVPIRAGYDGRLSPIDSTKAAVRYLKTLHGMFAGDWRLAVMAYNAGEYRVFSALRRSGQVARSADPDKLTSLSGISKAYVRKLHALSCLFDQADDHAEWMRALDRPVPVLGPVAVPAGTSSLDTWARHSGRDPFAIERLNPVLAPLGVPDEVQRPVPLQPAGVRVATVETSPPVARPRQVHHRIRTHRVGRGETIGAIARRYRIPAAELLSRNSLVATSSLRTGMVLDLDADVDQ